MSTAIGRKGAGALTLVSIEEGPALGAAFNLTDNRPEITYRFDGGDIQTRIVYANGVEIGRMHTPGRGGYRIPNSGEPPFATGEECVERLLALFIERHASTPRVCVERNVPLPFFNATEQIVKLLRNAIDFGVLDRFEFHHLLVNLVVACDTARADAVRYLSERLGELVSLSAARRDEPNEIELYGIAKREEGGGNAQPRQ